MRILISIVVLVFTSNAFASKEAPKVSLAKLNKTTLEKTLFFPVAIKSKVHSKIQSDNSYIVIKRLVNLGQKVKKGTPLLILRNQDMSVHYEKRILKSPIAGVVASISVNDGQYITKGENLILLNDPKNLYGKIEVSAADYQKMKINLKGTLDIKSLTLKDIPVTVKGIGTAVDHLTGTVSVELEINDLTDKLIPGVIGLAQITLNKEERLLVKEKSLYYIGEEVFIATLIDQKVKKIKVKLGQRHKDKIEIISGLDHGKTYIEESPKFLRDNEEVEIIKKK